MGQNMYTRAEVLEMQKRPWERQVLIAQSKIISAMNHTGRDIKIAFSGGKDSCLVADLYAEIVSVTNDKRVELVFANTTIETKSLLHHVYDVFPRYLENRYGVRVSLIEMRPDVVWAKWVKDNGVPFISKAQAKAYRYIKKDMSLCGVTADEVIAHSEQSTYNVKWLYERGFSRTGVLSATGFVYERQAFGNMFRMAKKYSPLLYTDFMLTEQCCNHIKELSLSKITGNVITGEQANESEQRMQKYLKYGCNFELKNGEFHSRPLGPMSKQAVLTALYKRGVPLASDYGTIECVNGCYRCSGAGRTGCALCGFGIQFDPLRFARLVGVEDAKLAYAFKERSHGGLGYGEIIEFLNNECGTKIVNPMK